MALINCPDCDKEISTTAKACPKCGYALEAMLNYHEKDRKYKAQNKNLKVVLIILIVLIFLVFVFYKLIKFIY